MVPERGDETAIAFQGDEPGTAAPEVVQWASGLPKTRSDRIIRRILRKIAAGETEVLGDTSTLAESAVVDELIKGWGA